MPHANTLLLTATIAPSVDAAKHTQFDPIERLTQYRDALIHYLKAPGPAWRILFVDNSGHPLDALLDAASAHARPDRPVDFHSYISEVPAAWGKGRGEMTLIEQALAHFADLLAYDRPVWKITGRLKVRNIGRMIETQPSRFKVYADFRSVPLVGNRFFGNHCTDTKLIAFTPEGYDAYIRQAWPDHMFVVEQRLFETLQPYLAQTSDIVPRFLTQPHFEGTSGGSGKNYMAPPERLKTGVRMLGRKAAPWLWI